MIFAVIYPYVIWTSFCKFKLFFTSLCYMWVMMLLSSPFIALLLLVVANINICMFSFHVSSKLGLRFTTATIRLGSISLNMSKVISFLILLCQLCVFLIILKNSIKAAFSVTWSNSVDLHFFILKYSCMQPKFHHQRLHLMHFLFNKLIFWYFEYPWKKL